MIIFLKKMKGRKMKKPRVYIAMPCYDTMKVETCISLLNTYAVLARSGVECIFKSVKSSLVTHARNLLTAGFLASDYDYMLCVDADIEFIPNEHTLNIKIIYKFNLDNTQDAITITI